MSFTLFIPVRLLVASFVLITISACNGTDGSPESMTIATPPVDEPEVAAAVHAATEPEPCPAAPLAPEANQAIPVQETPQGSQATRPRPMRPAPPAAPARGRLAEPSHVRMGEELELARSTIANLERSNAELQQSLEDALRRLTEAQRRMIRGVALQ